MAVTGCPVSPMLLLLLLQAAGLGVALDNGLATTPQMGYNRSGAPLINIVAIHATRARARSYPFLVHPAQISRGFSPFKRGFMWRYGGTQNPLCAHAAGMI